MYFFSIHWGINFPDISFSFSSEPSGCCFLCLGINYTSIVLNYLMALLLFSGKHPIAFQIGWLEADRADELLLLLLCSASGEWYPFPKCTGRPGQWASLQANTMFLTAVCLREVFPPLQLPGSLGLLMSEVHTHPTHKPPTTPNMALSPEDFSQLTHSAFCL